MGWGRQHHIQHYIGICNAMIDILWRGVGKNEFVMGRVGWLWRVEGRLGCVVISLGALSVSSEE